MIPEQNNKEHAEFGKTLRVSRRGQKNSVLLVALCRPHVKNAFNDELYKNLTALLQQSSEDRSVSAIVITGTGEYFTSGADLRETNVMPADDKSEKVNLLSKPVGLFMVQLLKFPKVVCAAVNGKAVGIGVTLLLHCDLCYCTESATFWVPFTRIAFVPEFASSKTFVDTMGLAKANNLLLLGKQINASEAVGYNICAEIVSECDQSGDPFQKNSIGSKMCNEIDEQLLSLPLGEKTSEIFVSMIRARRQKDLEALCKEELIKLDERIESGDILEAAMQLKFGVSKKSKL